MSFEKARDIIDLAVELTGKRVGMSLGELQERFGASRRTAQRLTNILEQMFNAESQTDNDGRKRWYIKDVPFKELINITDDELATLTLAKDLLAKKGHTDKVGHINALDSKVRSLMPSKDKRVMNDAEDLMVAQGFAVRKGPRVMANGGHAEMIKYAIQACQKLKITYSKAQGSNAMPRTLAPHGILYGMRPYLIAFEEGDAKHAKSFRLDRIASMEVADDYFERDDTFSIEDHARKGYGSYFDEDEYGEVVWKFSPEAADNARSYQFHPDQVQEEQTDGSLIVRFHASGLLEMAWDLYRWGHHVEVIKPAKLKDMVDGFQRQFDGMP